MRNKLVQMGIWLMVLLMGISVDASAQMVKSKKDLDKKSLKAYQKAISEGRKGSYKKSLKLYDKVLKKHPEFIDALLRKAGMLHNMKSYKASAETFEQAIAMAPEYNEDVYFSLGMVYRDMKKFDLAARNFQFFIDRSDNERRIKRAINYRDRTSFSHEAITNPVPFKPIKVEGGVNTPNSEYIPMMTMEGDRMIFTRRVGGQEDFYIAEVVDGKFTRTVPIDGLNTPQNEGIHTMSADGRIMIFTACDRRRTGVGSCDLYYARLDSDSWTVPANMGKVVNSINWDAQPSLSSDGKTLIFSSNRQDGYGGNDLWMTTRTDTSTWTLPVLMPSHINTPGNEESPFIHPDGHTLYFRSDTHIGMGGYDIFYSRYIDSTQTWSKPTNIGYPINTEGNEGALSVSLDGSKAFFASDMAYLDDKVNANLDIYTFELYEEARPMLTTFVKAKVRDKETGAPLKAKYTIEVLSESLDRISGKADYKGAFINSLPTNRSYALFVEMDGYVHYSENFDLVGIQNAIDPYIIEIELTKAEKEVVVSEKPEPIVLNNIFFESGSAELKMESSFELDRLADNLKANPEMKIQIHGHTDDIGDEAANQLLSEQRAKSVVDALVERGVSPTKLSSIGYGETQPIADNTTEEGRSVNRRTEFVLK